VFDNKKQRKEEEEDEEGVWLDMVLSGCGVL
jgi:hypothetical protein